MHISFSPAAAAVSLLLLFSMTSPVHGHHNHAEEHAPPAGRGGLFAAEFAFPAGPPAAGEESELRIKVTDSSGRPVENFDIHHEKPMHLIIVSADLAHFLHLHPDYEGGGVFAAGVKFPSAGRYKLFADFVPAGGAPQTVRSQVIISGLAKPAPPLVPDAEGILTAEGTKVLLEIEEEKDGAAALVFRFFDARTGRAADGMEPLLGAAGHVVIVSADAETYLHVHPDDAAAPGPEARFRTVFPAPGLYKVWGQFQRNGRPFTVAYAAEIRKDGN